MGQPQERPADFLRGSLEVEQARAVLMQVRLPQPGSSAPVARFEVRSPIEGVRR